MNQGISLGIVTRRRAERASILLTHHAMVIPKGVYPPSEEGPEAAKVVGTWGKERNSEAAKVVEEKVQKGRRILLFYLICLSR